VNFDSCQIWDHSGLEAIKTLITKYHRADKEIAITGVRPECAVILKKAGHELVKTCLKTHRFELLVKET
jgi:SulP family sulfate permease